jgi:uncharacterized protein
MYRYIHSKVAMLEVLIIAFVTLLGVVTQRIVGFGVAAFLTPVTLLFFDPSATVVIALLVGTLSCAIILLNHRHRSVIVWPVVVRLLLTSIPGLLLGAYIVTRINKGLLQIVLGIVVVGGVLIQEHVFPKPSKPLAVTRGINVSGFAAGILNATAGNSIPPLILWLRLHVVTADQMRQNLAALFVFMNVCSMVTIGVLQSRSFNGRAVTTFLFLIPVIVVANIWGADLAKKVNARQYEKLVVGMVIGTGLVTMCLGIAHYV